jgi:hypothetical protein
MSCRWPVLLVWVLPVAGGLQSGCLQEGPVPTGRQLFRGQHIEAPGFIQVGDQTMVRFEDRKAYATTTLGGVSDLWVSSFDGTLQRKVVTNRTDSWGEQYNAGDRYFMVDEHVVASGAGSVRAASLLRLGPTLDEEFRLDGIVRYSIVNVPLDAIFKQPEEGQTCPGFPDLKNDCPQLFYERPTEAGQTYPTLMLWDGQSHLPLGADAGSFQVQTMGRNAYFLLDNQHVLTRLSRPSYALDGLRANVYSFMVSGDERYAAITVNEEGKSKTVIRNLVTGAEISPSRPNPSGWGGFGGDTFYYSQNATATAPAETHALNLTTGEDTFETLPSPLVNSAGELNRPNSDERLLLDSQGHGVFTGKGDLVARRTLNGPLLTPEFSPDGKYLAYVAPAELSLLDTTIQGTLMFQDADLTSQEPTMVSPPGLQVNAQNGKSYFFTEGDKGQVLVFWAHLGSATSDLYFADFQAGALPTGLRLIAKSILSVSISAHSLFGILNMSQQDGVGDLVYRDIDKGVDVRYAQAVTDVNQCPSHLPCTDWFAYVVRGRAESDRAGLWLNTLAPPVPPDGGTD